jgi:AraC-like DNA-binding protein
MSGLTGINSNEATPAATSGNCSSADLACSTDSTFMRKMGPAFSRNQNCSILPSRSRSLPGDDDLVARAVIPAALPVPNHLAQADPLISRFEKWAREHLKEGFSLQDAADALAMSPRSLQRRCEAILGKSPLAYFQDLRVERAQSLIHGSGLDIEAIAAEVGYDDGATLRALLRRRLGRGVRELRAELR